MNRHFSTCKYENFWVSIETEQTKAFQTMSASVASFLKLLSKYLRKISQCHSAHCHILKCWNFEAYLEYQRESYWRLGHHPTRHLFFLQTGLVSHCWGCQKMHHILGIHNMLASSKDKRAFNVKEKINCSKSTVHLLQYNGFLWYLIL